MWQQEILDEMRKSQSALGAAFEHLEQMFKRSIISESTEQANIAGPTHAIAKLAHENEDMSKRIVLLALGMEINLYYRWLEKARRDERDYERKKENVREINARLRETRAAMENQENGEPCIIYAVTNHDGSGRYTLESRITKKRAGSYKSIIDLLPMKLVPDVPRREGVISRRKIKE